MKKALISEKELTLIISNLIITKMIFSYPRNLFFESGNAAWIEALFMSLITVLLFGLTFLAYKNCGNQNILEISETIGKKPLKVITAIIAATVLTVNFTSELRTFAESVKIVLLPQTDIEYIMILIAIAFSIGAKKGISALATVNAIFFPICLVLLGSIAIFLIRNYNFNNLFPMLGEGTDKILMGGMRDLSCFSDILVLNILLPHSKNLHSAKASGKKAIIISSIALILICLCYGLCYPYYRAKEFLLPVYQLSRMIRAGEYFQRFEAFFEFVWTITELMYGGIYIYAISETIAEGFEMRQNAIVYAVSAICVFIALMPSSVIENIELSKKIGNITFPIAIILPIIFGIAKRSEKIEK